MSGDNAQKDKQLIIFLAKKDSNGMAELGIPVRTFEHAMTHLRKYHGDTSAVIISDDGSILQITKKEDLLATKKLSKPSESEDSFKLLEKKSKALPVDGNQFTKALIIGPPTTYPGEAGFASLSSLLKENMKNGSKVRVQICNFADSGVKQTIPDFCQLSIPEEYSAISPNDVRAIDFCTYHFDQIKVPLASLLKSSNTTRTIAEKLPQILDLLTQTAGVEATNIRIYDGGNTVAINNKYSYSDAAKEGNVKYVKEYLKMSNTIDDADLLNLMSLAEEHGQNEIVNLLQGDDTLLQRINRKAFEMAIMEGDENQVVQFIAAGADINQKDEDDQTPLHYAARANNAAIAKLLCDNNADINSTDDSGKTPIRIALELGNYAIVYQLLKEDAVLNPTDHAYFSDAVFTSLKLEPSQILAIKELHFQKSIQYILTKFSETINTDIDTHEGAKVIIDTLFPGLEYKDIQRALSTMQNKAREQGKESWFDSHINDITNLIKHLSDESIEDRNHIIKHFCSSPEFAEYADFFLQLRDIAEHVELRPIFTGAYDQMDLVKYLGSLEKAIEDANIYPPITLNISGIHELRIRYDGKKFDEPWSLIEVESKTEEEFSNERDLAHAIIHSLSDQNNHTYAIFSTTCNTYDTNLEDRLFTKWQASNGWQQIHRLDEDQRFTRLDANKNDLFTVAINHDDEQTANACSALRYPQKSDILEAIKIGSLPLFTSMAERHDDIQHPCDVQNNETVLHFIAYHAKNAFLAVLIKNNYFNSASDKALFSSEDKNGNTPLHLALYGWMAAPNEQKTQYRNIVDTILSYTDDFDCTKKNKNGDSIVELAMRARAGNVLNVITNDTKTDKPALKAILDPMLDSMLSKQSTSGIELYLSAGGKIPDDKLMKAIGSINVSSLPHLQATINKIHEEQSPRKQVSAATVSNTGLFSGTSKQSKVEEKPDETVPKLSSNDAK